MKKFLKITGIIVGVLILLLFLTPIIFESQLKDLVRKTINENLNAKISFSDIDLSLFRNFPDATLGIEELRVINNAPFEGDTLAYSEEVLLQMSVKELFKGSGEAMHVDEFIINNTLLNIKIDSLGNANYDIAVESSAPVTDTTAGSGFQFDVDHYEINDSQVNYFNEGSKIELVVQELNHRGTGDFSAETSTLSTSSTALVSFAMEGTNYLEQNKVQLAADFQMDLEEMKFTFLENEALINQLPLTFDGYVQVNEENNEVDLSFETPTSSFKNFLAVIPEEYSKNIQDVETKGDFVVSGRINGIVDEIHIPKMDINIASENAFFKYPDLPKSVEDITIAVEILNETGLPNDTYVDIQNLDFRIDEDVFSSSGSIRNLTENMLVNLALKGTLNLANIEKAYPLELEQELNGVLRADFTTSFDMNSLENEQYQNVKSSGTASLVDFGYTSPEIPNEVKIASAGLNFHPGTIALNNFKAITGETDIAATGTIQNLMGFLFIDQTLKGNFNVVSNTFSVNDFMVAQETSEAEVVNEETPPETVEEAIKIPSFLDANISFAADRVFYDNLVLQDTKGNLTIANETATLNNVTSSLLGGGLVLNGNVSTREPVPTFDLSLDLNAIDIAASFDALELLQNLAPIATALQGELTTNLDLEGDLNNDLTPRLETIAGNALAKILGAEVDPAKTPLLVQLDQQLDFINLEDLDLSNLSTRLTFNNGIVEVQPFDFNIKGIQVTAQGQHGFDLAMDYVVEFDIPAKFLGSEVGGALSRLTASELQNTMVALPIGITGSFQDPVINLNMEQAVKNLTQKIINNQKQELKEKGKDVLTDILTGNRSKNTTPGDTVRGKTGDTILRQQDQVKNAAKEILGGIFGNRKKKEDTLPQN